MADEQPPSDGAGISDDELIGEVRRRLEDLSPEKRQELLRVLRVAKGRQGGRPKGASIPNMPIALSRMADLLLDTPSMSQRAAAEQIGGPLGVSPERLRKCFAADRAALMDAARTRKNPPPPAPVPARPAQPKAGTQGPTPPFRVTPPPGFSEVKLYGAEDIRRQLEASGHGLDWYKRLKEQVALVSIGTTIEEARKRYEGDLAELTKETQATIASHRLGFEELCRRTESASEETREHIERLLAPGLKTGI